MSSRAHRYFKIALYAIGIVFAALFAYMLGGERHTVRAEQHPLPISILGASVYADGGDSSDGSDSPDHDGDDDDDDGGGF